MGFFKKNNDFTIKEKKRTLHKNLSFTALEQYKLLRANLDFTLPEDVKHPVIGITSSIKAEGKSTTSINLAYVLAERGDKVLLIDADLRLPSIARKMGVSKTPGLTDLLMGREVDLSVFKSQVLDNWYILPAGEIPPNPSELLGSKRTRKLLDTLKEKFDYIILDLPPVNIVSDALSVSGFLTGMVLVVRQGYTEMKELERSYNQLKLSNVNILGCVMTHAKTQEGSYKKYKSYKYYTSVGNAKK